MKTSHFATLKRFQKARRKDNQEQKKNSGDPVFLFMQIRGTLK